MTRYLTARDRRKHLITLSQTEQHAAGAWARLHDGTPATNGKRKQKRTNQRKHNNVPTTPTMPLHNEPAAPAPPRQQLVAIAAAPAPVASWFEVGDALAERSCDEHTLLKFHVVHCRCKCDVRVRGQYNALLDAASDACGDAARQLSLLLDALQLCDDDPALHRACMTLGNTLGFMPK
jgi:hypothetical protein